MAKSNSSIWVSLGLNTDKFKKGLKSAKQGMSSMEKFGKKFGTIFDTFNLVSVGAVALGAVILDAVGIFKDFEKAGSDLKAVLGKNALPKDLENLAIQAKRLGAATAFTATEVRMLQKEFAKLGFDPSQIENMTQATLNLAAAAGVDLSEAAMQAGVTIRAFGLVSQDATHVTDVMAASFSKSALDMEKFSETMKNAAPIARATGVSLEIATAAAGKLADAGISGSKAGTDLRRVFSELVKDGKPFAESLNDIAKEMDNATSPAERLGIAEKLVGDRAKGALLILVDQKDALGELATELENADGAAQAMADTMLNNLSGDITKASSAWEGFILSLEDGTGIFSKISRFVVRATTDMLNFFTALNSAEARKGFNDLSDKIDVLNDAFSDGKIDREQYQKAHKEIEEGAFNSAQAVRVYIKSMAILDKRLKDGKITLESYNKTVSTLKDRINEAIKPTKEIAEVMPDVAKETELTAEELAKLTREAAKLTKEQEKAAMAARKLELNLESLKDVKLGVLFGDARRAVGELAKELEPKKPIEMKLMVNPFLEVAGGDAGTAITGAMVDLGIQAGEALSNSLVAAAAGALSGLGAAIGSGEIANIGEQMTGAFAGLLETFGQQMIQLGLAQAALKLALSLGPLGAGVAIGAGVALIAAASAIKSNMSEGATGFAQGGIVTGSVFANVGEGRGTTKSNPEIIAPLDKLKNMIGGSGGGMSQRLEFEIRGETLVAILNRMDKNNKFS